MFVIFYSCYIIEHIVHVDRHEAKKIPKTKKLQTILGAMLGE